MSGLYIHIPFCASRCIYCDFYSTTSRNRTLFIDRLISEIKTTAELSSSKYSFIENNPVTTVYMGGGTPSQLSSKNLNLLVSALESSFDLSNIVEFTMEMNPEDISAEYLKDLPKCINRVSIGVQSFVDSELSILKRRHNSQRPIEAIQLLKQHGINNISLDLMYGLPGQTLESFAYSIDKAIEQQPQHISAYNLTIEEGTPISRMIHGEIIHSEMGEFTLPDDDLCNKMNDLLRQKLKEEGYTQYEISNYSLPGYESKHNSSYWNGTPYIGLGPGAHSYDGRNHRWWNEPDLQAYLNGSCTKGEEWLSKEDLYNERIMLSLRTRHGISVQLIKRDFREYYSHFIKESEPLLADGSLSSTGNSSQLYYYISDQALAMTDSVIKSLMI